MRGDHVDRLTTRLDIAGLSLLVAFAGLVWWPLALGAAGAACLLLSWRLAGRRPHREEPAE